MPTALWPNIEWLIEAGGGVSLSTEKPIGCIASAADEDTMLVRRDGESLHALLRRLDQAIESAAETSETVDEINP